MKKLAIAAALAFTMSAPLHAQILLSDNFNGEDVPGSTVLNYNLFSNWNVTGAVDLVNNGAFGVNCPSAGKCVDLAGSPGPGRITTKSFYSFVTGDKMNISWDLSGSQRDVVAEFSLFLGFSSATSGTISAGTGLFSGFNGLPFGPSSSVEFSTGLLSNTPFATNSVEFTALSSGSLTYGFGTNTDGNAGPILDNVVISKTAATTSTVPEPSTYAMMAFGLLAVVGASRRRRA
ncbi:MAG: PEP-CTERM sorting domain-containing protein [Gemmatimonadaceae bacterium]